MTKVAVIGEGVIDRFLEGTGSRDVIGGSPLNTAVALRRSGVSCDWWGRLSLGPEGDALAAYAADNDVAGDGVHRVEQPATIVTIEIGNDGHPTYDFQLDGASDWGWTLSELNGLAKYDLIQIGSLTSVLEPGSTALLARVNELRALTKRPLITFDPNARPKSVKSDSDANRVRQRVADFVAMADLVKVSDEDLEWLNPEIDPYETARDWSTHGPDLVIMTRGSAGAVAFASGKELASTPGVTVEVIDTVGAGDTFMAWLIRNLVEEQGLQVPSDSARVSSILSEAAAAAAITCSRKGCNPPDRIEVLQS